MTHNRKLTLAWFALLLLTLAGGYLGETADPGFVLTLVVALVVAVKGRLVIDHFMELQDASPRIRRLMKAYFFVLPGMIVAVDLFSGPISRLTSL